jgi:PiT family inorganic phosphate transporter
VTGVVILTVLGTVALAWANGANDVSKGVATLVGSGQATYAAALRWGTLCTVAGAVASLALSAGLLETFSTALVAPEVSALEAFPLAVAGGAFAWVLLASLTGMPVSTTHALTGAMVGTGLFAGGSSGVRWPVLMTAVVLPLALSPFLAGGLSRVLHALLRRPLEQARQVCVCIDAGAVSLQPLAGGTAAAQTTLPLVRADSVTACDDTTPATRMVVADGLHWGTSGVLSFARGLNDTPKILGVAALALATHGATGMLLIAFGAMAMGAGSLMGRKVTRTLAERVTEIDPVEGLAASGVAAALVLLASFVALPVSTTHVATGAIVGAGLSGGRGAVRWRELSHVAVAWLVTLPVAALMAAGIAWTIA